MRADRLLSILLLLQVQQRITARELAKRLEVSERTIHRDMEALGMAGVPVTAERGTHGGWSLLEAYRTNLTGLNEAEVQTLFLSNSTRLLSDLGLRKAADAALIKLLAAIPTVSRQNAEYVRQRIYIDATSWHATEHDDLSSLALLQEALWREHKLLIAYQRSDTVAVERLVDPLGLIAKGSTWYLVAAIEREIRTYRVSRITRATLQEQASERPLDFDLAAYWTQSSARFVAAMPRYPVTVRVAPDVLERISHAGRYARIEHMHAPDAEGWIELALCFEMEEAACGYLLSFGVRVEILEPLALRAQVITLAENVAAFYVNILPNSKK
jgi:predicted DNA-binding transcriptional regulator YafY